MKQFIVERRHDDGCNRDGYNNVRPIDLKNPRDHISSYSILASDLEEVKNNPLIRNFVESCEKTLQEYPKQGCWEIISISEVGGGLQNKEGLLLPLNPVDTIYVGISIF